MREREVKKTKNDLLLRRELQDAWEEANAEELLTERRKIAAIVEARKHGWWSAAAFCARCREKRCGDCATA